MALVKIRRVGNSNVITLPAGVGGPGFEAGKTVLVEPEDDGTLRVIPVEDVDAHVRAVALAAIERRRQTLDVLAAHDRNAARSDPA